ncbi:MAG: hypothetical protein ABSC23_03945 [Bryobacteraceae bacterium]|jgi:hypothetical protein
MTGGELEAARRLIEFYRRAIPPGIAEKADGGEPGDLLNCTERLRHLRWMFDEMERMEDVPKVNRWLGFIQGVLFASGMCSIDDLRRHVTGAKGGPNG